MGNKNTLLLSESLHNYYENKPTNKLLQFSVFKEQCGCEGENVQLDSSGSEKVSQRGKKLSLAELMLFSR